MCDINILCELACELAVCRLSWAFCCLQQQTWASSLQLSDTYLTPQSVSWPFYSVRKTLHYGLWNHSGTLNVCLSGGLTTLGHTHKHIQRLAATGQSITQNKAWKPRVKPSRPCERVIVCEAVCAFQCVRVMTAAVAKEWPSIRLKWAKHPWVKLYYVDHP